MIDRIYNNLDYTHNKSGIAKSTFYHWLNGRPITIPSIARVQEVYNIAIGVDYIHRFSTLASRLKETDELTKIAEILNTDYILDKEDKILLGDYHISRIWKKHKNTFSVEDLCDEC